MSQRALASVSPLSQAMISSVANSTYLAKIGKVKCKEFGEWYLKFRKEGSIINSQPQASTSISNRRKMVTTDTRFTFHPAKELPLLREWFKNCRNPSEKTIQTYIDQLNKNAFRLARPKVTLIKVKNWFKNERQRERRHKSSDNISSSKRKKRNSSVENTEDQITAQSIDIDVSAEQESLAESKATS